MRDFHILLATDRPAIHALFSSLPHYTSQSVVINRIPLSTSVLANYSVDSPIVAVVDVASEPIMALQFCQSLHERIPKLPILGLLCCPHALTPWQLQTFLSRGVTSLADLQSSPKEMLQTLHDIGRGDIVLQARLHNDHEDLFSIKNSGYEGCNINNAIGELSNTGMLVLALLVQGFSDSEIGQRLCLSPHTVKHLIERLRDNVGARNRIALAAWAGHQGFSRAALGEGPILEYHASEH